jgi:dethiobiotin synthetase
MKRATFFITGTDTGVGKTVLTALLARHLRERGINAVALKLICSGGRDDARVLHAAMNGALTPDEINPWHFSAPIAPLLAARREHRLVRLVEALAHVRAIQKRFDVVLVEGAGGLLSPLGEDFNSRDLISALRATPIIVAPNKLGVVNHVRLTLEALPKTFRAQAKIVLVSPAKPDSATASNAELLEHFVPSAKIFLLPWFKESFSPARRLETPQVKRTLAGLVDQRPAGLPQAKTSRPQGDFAETLSAGGKTE